MLIEMTHLMSEHCSTGFLFLQDHKWKDEAKEVARVEQEQQEAAKRGEIENQKLRLGLMRCTWQYILYYYDWFVGHGSQEPPTKPKFAHGHRSQPLLPKIKNRSQKQVKITIFHERSLRKRWSVMRST